MPRKGYKMTDEHRKKMSEVVRGRKLSEETKAKLSAALKGRSRPMSEETKAKMRATRALHKEEISKNISESQIGKKLSEEHKAKLSAALKGKKRGPVSESHLAAIRARSKREDYLEKLRNRVMTQETRDKISNKLKGRPLSAEHREKISKIQTGRPQSEESNRKRSEKLKGRTLSTEHRAKLVGHKVSDETRKKIGKKLRGRVFSDETIEKMSKSHGYRNSKTFSGKCGIFRGFSCDSTWELQYIAWCLDTGKKIERNKKGFPYEYNGQIKRFYPDFIVDGQYVEVKAMLDDKTKAKLAAFPHPITVLYGPDLKPMFDHFRANYPGKPEDHYEKSVEPS